MKQQFEIILNQKQKFSSKLVPSMEILTLSQQDLENLVDASLMENPFSDIDQTTMSLESRDIDLDFKNIRKKQDDLQDFDYEDDTQDDLMDYVMPQLYPYIHTKRDEEVFTVIIESLDSRGFLVETEEDLCKFLNIKRNKLRYYLDIIKHCDPLGLAAKDVQECILIQLSTIADSTLAQHIIKDHLEAVSQQRFEEIARKEHTNKEAVLTAMALIQSLNPIPANGFRVKEKPLYIIPDVYIRTEENSILIEMNAKIQEKLKMNEDNLMLYKSTSFDKDAKAFLKKKLDEFKWLQYSVSRRAITLEKIVRVLVEHQQAYFLTGNEQALQPLRLVDIAEKLNMHTSTISRAIANKFFQCAYGTYSFHYLMPRCYEKQGSVAASIDTIKNEIKEIIKSEDKHHPFSDEKIHQMLEEEGFTISRRSVTLYRKECDIPSSRSRKIR